MKASQLLREAKNHLWDGCSLKGDQNQFICHALMDVAAPGDAYGRAREIIEDRLKPSWTLEGWLIDQQIDFRQMTYPRMQAYRQQWLDLLIAEFEAKGD